MKLGGPGNQTWNLVPTSTAVNGAFEHQIESYAKTSANTNHRWTYVDVSLIYTNGWPAPIPSSINAEWGNWNAATGQWVQRGALLNPLQNPDITAIGTNMAYLRGDNITQYQVGQRNVPPSKKAAFTNWLKTYRANVDNWDTLDKAAEAQFGEDYDTGWITQMWLDEDPTNPGTYQAVVKAM